MTLWVGIVGVPGFDKCTPDSSGFSVIFDTYITVGKTTNTGSKDEHTDVDITMIKVELMPMDVAHVDNFNDPSWHAGIYTGLRQVYSYERPLFLDNKVIAYSGVYTVINRYYIAIRWSYTHATPKCNIS